MSDLAPGDVSAGRTRARRLGGLVAGLLILAFLLGGMASGWDQVSDYDWRFDPGMLAAGILVVFAAYLTYGLGYLLILRRIGAGPGTWRIEVLAGWAKSLLGRYVPGTVLMLTARAVLGREAGVSARITLAASVYEQTLLLTTAAVGSVGFVVAYDGSDVSWILLAIAVALGVALIHPRSFRPLSSWLLTRVRREPLKEFLSAPKLAVLALFYGFANALMGTGVWLLTRSAAGPEAGDLPYVALAFLLSFTIGMLAWIVPSGLGVRDASFALALASNIAGSVAIALAAGVRIALTVVELVFVATIAGAARFVARDPQRLGEVSNPRSE